MLEAIWWVKRFTPGGVEFYEIFLFSAVASRKMYLTLTIGMSDSFFNTIQCENWWIQFIGKKKKIKSNFKRLLQAIVITGLKEEFCLSSFSPITTMRVSWRISLLFTVGVRVRVVEKEMNEKKEPFKVDYIANIRIGIKVVSYFSISLSLLLLLLLLVYPANFFL